MKSKIKDWLRVLISLLDETVAVGLIFLILWILKIEIPLWSIIAGALLLGPVILISHKAIIPTFHKKQITGADGLIGLECNVTQALTPCGLIKIKGEYWKAKSVGDNIAVGDKVEILRLDGLTLMVKPINHSSKRAPASTVQ